jgi:UDP-3-O-[3-hydroxymyristoyl] N-acetylglucosamine deacetylase
VSMFEARVAGGKYFDDISQSVASQNAHASYAASTKAVLADVLAGETLLAGASSIDGAFAPGPQTTLRQKVSCTGIGLHSGKRVILSLVPAEPETGIWFHRTDLSGDDAWIAGRWDQVIDTRMCTVVGNTAGAYVGTVEHLMAALAACGVDNVVVELDAPEPPAMDGSSAPFMFLIECAGVAQMRAQRSMLHVLKPVRAEEGAKFAALEPCSHPALDVEIVFENQVIGRQRSRMPLSAMRFKSELARARTFGFAEEVAFMRSNGLALGGSLDNAVVIDGDTVLNPEGLRYRDEFVRHKALDAVGDLYLCGGPIVGRYLGHQAGHKLNNLLLRALFADSTAYEWVDSALPIKAMARAAS